MKKKKKIVGIMVNVNTKLIYPYCPIEATALPIIFIVGVRYVSCV